MSTTSVNLTNSVLDVASIVDGLMKIESAPVDRMQSQVATLKSKISAYQTLNTKISALSDKVNTLLFGDTEVPYVLPYTFADRLKGSVFAQCTVTSSAEATISATAASANSSGDYAITVSNLAQAMTMASSGFASATSAVIGTGTFTITTGTGNPVTLTINSTDNSLTGLRNAINNANAGVTASIINDGSSAPYKLLITAKGTGTANAFTVTDNLSGGQALSFAQSQAASDALFVINGVSISKSSNTISDVIDGVTFTLKDKTTSPVTLSVQKDVDSIVKSIQDLVSAYNAVNSFINTQFTYNSSTAKAGVLSGDSTLRGIQSKLQSLITGSTSNRYTSYRVVGQVGLEVSRDGSITLNESKLRDAISKDPTSVAGLFLGDGTPSGSTSVSDNRVTYNGKTSATQAGTYSLHIDTLAQQASAVGTQMVSALSDNETLAITYGSTTATVDLLQNDALVNILFKINGAFSAQGMAVTATDDGTGKIKISTNGYGSSQLITVLSNRDGISGTTGFGTTPIVASGIDIAGTLGGHAAIGDGLRLTGAGGQPEEGLSVSIAQTTTGNYGSIVVASADKGIEGTSFLMNLCSQLKGITDPLSGPIHNATDGLNNSINYLNDGISSYNDRLEIRRQMLTDQFSAADQALRLMSVTQSSLENQLASLPK